MEAQKSSVTTCPLCAGDTSPLELYRSEIMRVVRCPKCGLMYQNPRVAETTWGDTYDVVPEYQVYRSEASRVAKERLFRDRVDAIQRRCKLPPSGAFLDIGASQGIMMQTLLSALPGWKGFGVEPSATAREYALNAGLSVVPALDALPAGQKYDWINLDNTLEHIEDPLGLLIELRGRLARNGFLYIEVPNESFFRLRYRINDAIRGTKKPPTFPGHLTLFTQSTLQAMLHRAGLAADLWTESVSAPNRMSGVCNQDEAQFRTVLTFLRVTKVDRALGLNYFLCAIARSAPA